MSLANNGASRGEAQLLDFDTIRAGLVAALIICIPFAFEFSAVVDVHSPFLKHAFLGVTVIGPIELILLLLAVASSPLLFHRATYVSWPIGLIGAVTLTVVTFVLVVGGGPTPEGIVRIVRFAGIAGAIVAISRMSPGLMRKAVIWPLAGTVALQAALALAQTFIWHSGRESGITIRFDHVWTQGYGTIGPYALATVLAVAIAIILSAGAFKPLHPLMWVSVVLGSAAIATTFGRSGAMAVFAIAGLYGVAWILKRKSAYLVSSTAAFLPMTIGMAIAWSGWSVRASETAAGEQWGREELLRRAFEIIRSNPLLGVGPGEYGPTLARTGLTAADITIVHNVPVLVAAEYGIPIGVMFTAWLGLLGVSALLTSARAAAVFVAIVPYLLLNHNPIVYGYGIALFGLWLATLDYHRAHRHGDAPSSESEIGEAAAATA
ncbi:MAG: O-antigen ligase family protein [Acidimicrobiia bacterium]